MHRYYENKNILNIRNQNGYMETKQIFGAKIKN